MTPSDPILLEAEFQERRRRILRGLGALLAAFAVGLAVLFAARAMGPDVLDGAIPFFVVGLGTASLALAYTVRRHWRCPACDIRWQLADALASMHWNHCPACGAALRVTPVQADPEQRAAAALAAEGLSQEALLARFRSARRRGQLAAGATVIAGLATFAWVHAQEVGEIAEQAVLALFTGIAMAFALNGARCPRCRVGIIAGKVQHCQRCGLQLL